MVRAVLEPSWSVPWRTVVEPFHVLLPLILRRPAPSLRMGDVPELTLMFPLMRRSMAALAESATVKSRVDVAPVLLRSRLAEMVAWPFWKPADPAW